jgi:hypothetical protein
MMTAFFALVYALGSMVLGDMLLLTPLRPPYFAEILWSGGSSAWNYPGLLIVQPWGVVELPFFATIAMVVVSIGVGIGMSVAVLLGIALVRDRRARAAQPAAVGSVAGLTPAMIALVTLGACCSTTAAATAGVGIVGQVSGSTTDNLLLNNWYLGVFQMVVVWVALLAQELLLRVYGSLFSRGKPADAFSAAPVPPSLSRWSVAGGLLRAALLVGGLTWSLAMLAAWTVTAPATASAGSWFGWVVQHQFLAILAILAALFPRGLAEALARWATTGMGRLLRVVLLVGGVTLAAGVPPPISAWGVAGLGNEVLSVLGLPASLGAVSPVFSAGLDLYFRWTVQYVLLGGFAIAVALAPRTALNPLLWSSQKAAEGPGSDAAPPRGVPRDSELRLGPMTVDTMSPGTGELSASAAALDP